MYYSRLKISTSKQSGSAMLRRTPYVLLAVVVGCGVRYSFSPVWRYGLCPVAYWQAFIF